MIEQTELQQKSVSSRRRPGPFGPARALLPHDQQPLFIADDEPASQAIERMIDNNFSQLPVNNEEGRIIGVFTWQSFGKRVSDLRKVKASIKPVELPVKEAMEPAHFIPPEKYIDTETDWGSIDYILVGDESHLLGILSIADVLGRLNDFAEAFVLLYEVEHGIRDLIRDIANEEELREMIGSMNLPPPCKSTGLPRRLYVQPIQGSDLQQIQLAGV